VQRKGVDREDRKVYCEFVWASNDPPRLTEDTDAIWSRLVVVKFPYKFEKAPKEEHERQAIPNLEAQLLTPQELSGLFNLLRKRMNILITRRDLSVDVEATVSRRDYRTISDTPAVFVEEMCEDVPYEASESFKKAKGFLSAEEAYRAYKDWCQDMGAQPVSANRFGRAMEKLGYERGKDEQVRSYRGLKLREKEESKEEPQEAEKETPGQLGTISPILPAGKGELEERIEKTVITVLPGQLKVTFDDINRHAFPTKKDVLEVIKIVKPMIPVEDLYAAFPGETRVDQWIAELKNEREIFEPRSGFLKVLE
jgi:phage/plasmid-associated DNA primase